MYQTLRSFKLRMRKNLLRYRRFLKYLERNNIRIAPKEVIKQNAEAFRKIDCGQCANCCKVMTPVYTFPDITRIAAHVGMTDLEYADKYLGKTKEGDIINRKRPCHFLGKNNRCSIYEIRPSSCRNFPYTHRKNLTGNNRSHLQNLEYCPITFEVVESIYKKYELEKKVGDRS